MVNAIEEAVQNWNNETTIEASFDESEILF